MATPQPTTQASSTLPVGYRLGEYVIQSVLGQGGFGVTYLANDTRLTAQVAVKEYFPQAFATRDVQLAIKSRVDRAAAETYRWGLEQFLKEAQALAKFKHNHIVRVLRFLEANGTAYMVMEYEEGESLADYVRKHGGFLDEPTLLSVFLPILSGLQAVHDAGLLHLDIKPDNIYLRANGQPMLIDFGSARQIRADTGQTVALTPQYSAIEHHPGQGTPGPWTDVYSIGATLYRCITGKPPVDVMERYNTVHRSTIDPLTPATKFERPLYSPHIRECVDLALKIAPQDRPQSAYALQQGLMGKDIHRAQPPSQSVFRFRSGYIGIAQTAPERKAVSSYSAAEKFVAYLVFLATAIVVTPKLLVGTNTITEAELFDQIEAYRLQTIATAEDLGRTINERVFGVKPKPAPAPKPAAVALPAKPAAVEVPIPAFVPGKALRHTLRGHTAPVVSLAFLARDGIVVSASDDGVVKFWSAETGASLRTLSARARTGTGLAVSPDGRWLALPGDNHVIHFWDIQNDRPGSGLAGHTDAVDLLAFSPDGQRLASASRDRTVIVWDLSGANALHHFKAYGRSALALAFSPSGRPLAAADSTGGIKYFDPAAGSELAYTAAQSAALTALAFSPDGEWLAAGGHENFLKLWRMRADKPDVVLRDVPDTVHAVAFSPDSRWILAAGSNDALHLWNVETGEHTTLPVSGVDQLHAVAVSPDGLWLAAGGDDKAVTIWH